MRIGKLQKVLLFFSLVCLNIVLLMYIRSEVQKRSIFSYETGMNHLIQFDVLPEVLRQFYEDTNEHMPDFLELLTLYMGMDCKAADSKELLNNADYVRTHHGTDYQKLYAYLSAVFNDMQIFPVGEITNMPSAGYSYVDSWQFARTYGGDRVHEGCDIMADINKRGIYPIYSATDGVVENIGWLKLGGYRIGIRSSSGAYYYYAHLSEYAKDFLPGEEITAGTLLGYMGDTGYSEIPGTYGKFDVHLHFGIYFNDEKGHEYAINPYPALYFCEEIR